MTKNIDDVDDIAELRELFMDKQTEAEIYSGASGISVAGISMTAPMLIPTLMQEQGRELLTSPQKWLNPENQLTMGLAAATILLAGVGVAAGVKSWRTNVEAGIVREKINATLTGEKIAESLEKRNLVVLKREDIELPMNNIASGDSRISKDKLSVLSSAIAKA